MLTALAARTAQMTEIDLIAAGPWILFGIALAAVCLQLARSRRAALRRGPADQELAAIATHRTHNAPRRTHHPGGGSAGTARRVRAPYWRSLLEARWQARLYEVTEAVAGLPRGGRAAPDGRGAAGQHELERLLRSTVAARRKLADTEEALARLAAGTFGPASSADRRSRPGCSPLARDPVLPAL